MPQNSTHYSGNRSAFSLTELLVALGLIVVLLVLAGPAFSGWRATVHTSQCLMNLKELGVCHRLWRQERNHQLWNSSERDIRPSRMFYEAGLITSAKSMQCPAATRVGSGAWIDDLSTGAPTTPYAREFKTVPISYGANRYAFSISWLTDQGGRFARDFRIFMNDEARMPVFMDATFWNLDASMVWNDASRSRIALRHHGRAQVVFLDGHVEQLDREGVLALTPWGVYRKPY